MGFLGANGAGKTTTMRMLCGLLTPTSGRALIDGFDIHAQPLEAKARLGYLDEEPFVHPHLTGREFLNYIADLYRMPRGPERQQRMERLLGLFELADRNGELIGAYSHGMKQKIGLAALLIREPSVLLLDEPTNGLHPRSARLVKDLLEDLAQIILKAELLAWRQRLLNRGPGRLVLLGIALLAAAVFIGGGAFTIGAAAGHFLPTTRDTILTGGFTSLSVLMLVIGFPTVIATFFVGRELLQLVLAPVRPIDIFAARLLVAMSANLLISSILLMSTLGVGVGSGAPLAYFPLAVVLIFVQVLVVTALQAILMSVVLRWVPARLARDVAAAVAGLAGAGFYLAWNINLRQSFTARHPDLSSFSSLVGKVEWLPSAWPGHALSAVIGGNNTEAATWVAFSLVFGVLVLAVAEILYRRTLLTGLGVFGAPPPIWRRGVAKQAITVARAGAASPFRAIALKDWLSYRPDIRRLSPMLPALLFPVGYAFAFLRPSQSITSFWTEVFLV